MFLGLNRIDQDKIAAIDDGERSITYGLLLENAKMTEEILTPRSVIFLLCENSVPVLSAYVGILCSNCIPLLLDKNMDSELFQNLIDTYKPQYIVAPVDSLSGMTYERIGTICEMDFLRTGFPHYPVHDDLELLLSTSGSTGSPKLVRHKKGNIKSSAQMVADAFGWTSDERPACTLPMNYTMGLNIINTHLYVGATLLMVGTNIASGKHWSFIREQQATSYTGVPFSYDIISKLKIFKKDWPDLTSISEGGGRLSEEMFEELANYAKDNNKKFFASFGTTETTSRISLLPPEEAINRICSIGKPIKGGTMVLVDPDSGEAIREPFVEGELIYRGPNVTMGYAENIEDLSKGDEFNGEYKTGDLAIMDDDGYYYIVGRRSRFLKLLGHRVDLDECQRMIKSRFDLDVACVGDDNGMVIYVEQPPSEIDDEISDFISEKAGITSSKFVVKNCDSIPRNTFGKIQYGQLDNTIS